MGLLALQDILPDMPYIFDLKFCNRRPHCDIMTRGISLLRLETRHLICCAIFASAPIADTSSCG